MDEFTIPGGDRIVASKLSSAAKVLLIMFYDALCVAVSGGLALYYKPDSEHEIEFLIEKDGEVIPVEVKAGNNPTPSLNSYIEDFSPSYAYKLIGGRNGTIGAKITLPHYFVMFI